MDNKFFVKFFVREHWSDEVEPCCVWFPTESLARRLESILTDLSESNVPVRLDHPYELTEESENFLDEVLDLGYKTYLVKNKPIEVYQKI